MTTITSVRRTRARRARQQTHPRLPRRRTCRRHDPPAARLGKALLPDVLLPARRRPHRPAARGRQHRPLAEPRRREIFTISAGGQERAGAALPLRATHRSTSSTTRSASTGPPWTPGSRRTRRSSPTRATRTPASTSSPARGTSGSRSTASPSPTRRSRGSCSRPAFRRATTCRRRDVRMDLLVPDRHLEPLPLQGRRELLVAGARRRRRRGLSPGLPDAAAREPEDRRPRLLLHREGRPLRRRTLQG